MDNKNTLDDIRATRLYELLAYLKPKQRKIISEISALKSIPIDAKKNAMLQDIIMHIDTKKNVVLSKAFLMEKSGLKSPSVFNYATSDLFKIVCKMLYLLNIQKDNHPAHLLSLTHLFIEKELPINTFHSLKELKASLKNKKIQAHDFHLYKMQYHELNLQQEKDTRRGFNEHFKQTNLNLDAFYAGNKLRLLCEDLNRNRIVQETHVFDNSTAQELLLSLIQENNYFESISMECYFSIYQMLSSNSKKNYQIAAKKINHYQEELTPNIEESFIAYLMNQCIYFMNKNMDRVKHANDYINYIDSLEEKGYLFTNKQLSPGRFQGIVVAGVMAKQVEWVNNFVHKKAANLNSPHQDFIKQIHLAYIAFHNDHVDLAYELISTVGNHGTADPFFTIFYYKLMIQIYFSQNHLLATQSKIDAFYKYIGRIAKKETIALDKIQALRKFISQVSKVIKLKLDPNTRPNDYIKLQEYLAKNKGNIAYSEWIEQIIKP